MIPAGIAGGAVLRERRLRKGPTGGATASAGVGDARARGALAGGPGDATRDEAGPG